MSPTESPKNPQRLTPYPNFRYKVRWDADYVAGVSRVSGLQRSTQVIHHRADGDHSTIHHAPGQTSYGPITLERGMSYDPAFETWANKVFEYEGSDAGAEVSLKDFRKNILIEVYNEAGQKVLAYNVYDAWVSDFQGLADLDANGDAAIAIQSMTLQNEGWERDESVSPVSEPRFVQPRGDAET